MPNNVGKTNPYDHIGPLPCLHTTTYVHHVLFNLYTNNTPQIIPMDVTKIHGLWFLKKDFKEARPSYCSLCNYGRPHLANKCTGHL
jgi:hypothetical protein